MNIRILPRADSFANGWRKGEMDERERYGKKFALASGFDFHRNMANRSENLPYKWHLVTTTLPLVQIEEGFLQGKLHAFQKLNKAMNTIS